MELKKVDIEEFKKDIYPEYKKLFPKLERTTYADLKKAYDNHITDLMKIVVENEFVGFVITNFLKDNPYIELDYIAILPQYQHKGYGSAVIKLLKEIYKDYDGIFIEIEKLGYGENKKENVIRSKRAKFYENLGFCKLQFDLELYTIRYDTYILPCKRNDFCDDEVINKLFKIYVAILGEDRVNKNYKVVR